MSATRSADDLIVAVENQKLGIENTYVPPVEDSIENNDSINDSDIKSIEKDSKTYEATEENNAQIKESKAITAEKTQTTDSKNTDDYGNEIPKHQERTYTEAEVNAMIRDRLSRGRHAENQTPQQQQETKEAAKDFTPDPTSNESWEIQLEQFIEKSIQKREQKLQTQQWQQKEQQIQAEFEVKFTSGMAKYKDFHEVCAGKPITDAMMLAARGMNDPAAFIYAASKHHSQELERIAKMADPYQQGMEIGKLEATMKKARAITNAAKPLSKTTGDLGHKEEAKLSIDDKIRMHAHQKFRKTK